MRFKLSTDAKKYYVRLIQEDKLPAIQPLLFMLSNDLITIEKLSDDDLTEDDKRAFEVAEYELIQGKSIDFEYYLYKRGIKAL